MKKKDLYEGMERATGKEKCICGHSIFRSHKLVFPRNKFKSVIGKCKFCKCRKGVVA